MIKQKFGFTLAEVLIVIGIIGVVAALTLPNLNHATGDKEKVTRVKKIYSALSDAVDRAQVIYGPCDEWVKGIENDYASQNERFAKRITEFMKVSKDCGFGDGCWAAAPLLDTDGSMYEDIDNYLNVLKSHDDYMVILSDGMSLAFEFRKIRVDIDGPNKGKNQYGNDIFDFYLFLDDDQSASEFGANVNQLYPSSAPNRWTGEHYWQYETAWVIENGNLDYLKTDEDGNCPDGQPLNWETKTSCK